MQPSWARHPLREQRLAPALCHKDTGMVDSACTQVGGRSCSKLVMGRLWTPFVTMDPCTTSRAFRTSYFLLVPSPRHGGAAGSSAGRSAGIGPRPRQAAH